MILADNQSGSKDLTPYIEKLTTEVISTRVDPPFGDFVWVGNGPDDKPIHVGVEYKKWNELFNSIIDGRFAAHQLPGMVEHYDRRYLLVEMGPVRTDRVTGNMEQKRGDRWWPIERNGRRVKREEFEHWQTSIEEQAQFRVKETFDSWESARWIVNRHSWYTDKRWNDHAALKQFHVPPPPAMVFAKPNLVRRWAKELEGVGWEKSLAAAQHFPTPLSLALANEVEWQRIDGIGPVLSSRIVKSIRGE